MLKLRLLKVSFATKAQKGEENIDSCFGVFVA